jgi:hypothetical protein
VSNAPERRTRRQPATYRDNLEWEAWFLRAYPGATIERVNEPGLPTRYVGTLPDDQGTAASHELIDVIRKLDHLHLWPGNED